MMNKYDIGVFVGVLTEQAVVSDLVDRFKKRRKEHKISQKMLAQRSGVSYASIRRFESTGEISLNSLLKISKVINCLEDFNSLFKVPYIHDLKEYRTDD